jgi:hypothetical protein
MNAGMDRRRYLSNHTMSQITNRECSRKRDENNRSFLRRHLYDIQTTLTESLITNSPSIDFRNQVENQTDCEVKSELQLAREEVHNLINTIGTLTSTARVIMLGVESSYESLMSLSNGQITNRERLESCDSMK